MCPYGLCMEELCELLTLKNLAELKDLAEMVSKTTEKQILILLQKKMSQFCPQNTAIVC